MSMTREEAHKLIDELFDTTAGVASEGPIEYVDDETEVVEEPVVKDLPEGKRAVRTKSSGDRVYCLDEVKKTRQWVTNPEILAGLGFDASDVVEVDDAELLRYQMGPALYKLAENA